MRIPNSCVRWLTENAITPAMPAAVMTSASNPNMPISATTTRRGASAVDRTSASVRKFVDRQIGIVRARDRLELPRRLFERQARMDDPGAVPERRTAGSARRPRRAASDRAAAARRRRRRRSVRNPVGCRRPAIRVPIGSSLGQNCFAADLVDDDDASVASKRVGRRERASGDERLPERLEVVRRRDPEADLRRAATPGGAGWHSRIETRRERARCSFNGNVPPPPTSITPGSALSRSSNSVQYGRSSRRARAAAA